MCVYIYCYSNGANKMAIKMIGREREPIKSRTYFCEPMKTRERADQKAPIQIVSTSQAGTRLV